MTWNVNILYVKHVHLGIDCHIGPCSFSPSLHLAACQKRDVFSVPWDLTQAWLWPHPLGQVWSCSITQAQLLHTFWRTHNIYSLNCFYNNFIFYSRNGILSESGFARVFARSSSFMMAYTISKVQVVPRYFGMVTMLMFEQS